MALVKNDVSKDELNRQRRLDRTLLFASKNIQKDFNIYGYQKEDHVIRNGEKNFIAVFSVKSSEAEVNIYNLNKILCANLAQRYRISVFCQNVNDVLKKIVYLSVFFDERSYYLVHDQLTLLKSDLSGLKNYGFIIEALSLDSIFSYWKFNMTGNFEDINALSVLSSKAPFEKANPKIKERFLFEWKGMSCASLKLIGLSDFTKPFPFNCFNNFKKTYIATDVWKVSEVDFESYNKMLNLSFYPGKKYDNADVNNFSLSIVVMDNSDEELKQKLEDVYVECQKHGFIIVPCYGNENDYYMSLSSFGIVDFSNMLIVKNEQVNEFYRETM